MNWTLMDLLNWAGRNGWAAFFTAVFIVIMTSIIVSTACDFFVKIVRSITGHYPAPSPVVDCDCDPCYCCRTGECSENCRCYGSERVTGDGTDA